nr:PREDICTED: UDP-GlcNAc:betaGal beta-1,3-N-acetylglucosaminyltransferase 7-like [Latimeria chalumnae]|eukprot:XP_006009901.1 PREDICTED: UDP-GlcNAc:betaGal beta-1,3-N-acetylglucosaminyltransferase 7-like [Latimeria chalumnae]
MCKTKENIFLLLVIKSLAENADRRAAVRSTWGRETVIGGRRVHRVFLLGQTQAKIRSKKLQALIQEESEVHGDIIQWAFRESFFNVTLKEYLLWKWFTEECHTVSFVFKGDDDVYVNVANIIQFLSDYNPNENLYAGDVFINTYAVRLKWSKYYIPLLMYGNKPYPPYIGGGGYLLSRQSIKLLQHAFQKIDIFPIDDAYVGMCAEAVGIKVMSHAGFRTHGQIPYDPCIYKELILVHKVLPNELYLIWSLIKHSTEKCSRIAKANSES